MGILRDATPREGNGRATPPEGQGGPPVSAPPAPPSTAPVAAPAVSGPPVSGPAVVMPPSRAPSQPPAQAAGSSPGAPGLDGRSDLRRRRDTLAEQVTELNWDLGGLTYEMAIRDHFRLDVLVRRAAILQERDAELAEVERLLRMEDGGVAGSCPACAAPHSRGALYCWQCGSTLMERTPSSAITDPTADTAVIDTLLSGSPADLVEPGERDQ